MIASAIRHHKIAGYAILQNIYQNNTRYEKKLVSDIYETIFWFDCFIPVDTGKFNICTLWFALHSRNLLFLPPPSGDPGTKFISLLQLTESNKFYFIH